MRTLPIRAALALIWSIACLQALAQPDSREMRIREIVEIASRAEMPLMKQEVIPLLAASQARKLIGEEGRRLGFGNEWNADVPEWREAEKKIEQRLKDAMAKAGPSQDFEKLNTCLRSLQEANLAALHETMRSDLWPRYRQAVDTVGVVFALLGGVDRSLSPRLEVLMKKVQAQSAEDRNVVSEVQARLMRPGIQECFSIIESSIAERTGSIWQRASESTEAAKPLIAASVVRFEAGHRHLAPSWLWNAVSSGNVARVTQLLDSGVDVNVSLDDRRGAVPLHLAAERADATTVKLLLQRGAAVNARNASGDMPLHNAVLRNSLNGARVLLDRGAEINAAGSRGTPLGMAARAGSDAMVDLLLSRGAEATAVARNGDTLLHEAAKSGRAAQIARLAKAGASVRARNEEGLEPLHLAASAEVAQALLALGAQIEARDLVGRTPLRHAVARAAVGRDREFRTAEALREAGASPVGADADGATILHFISGQDAPEAVRAVRWLAAQGADVNARDAWGLTPLHYVRRSDVAEALIAVGASVRSRDKRGNTVLRYHCLFADPQLVATLAKWGAGETECPRAADALQAQKKEAPKVPPAGCGFGPEVKLPPRFALYAAGAHSGRALPFQIDQSGGQATRMDVSVNVTQDPIILLVGAYYPTVWNIRWTAGTQIAAVVATGFHRQAIAGLPRSVPVLYSTFDNKGACGYSYFAPNDQRSVSSVARRIFGRDVDRIFLANETGVIHVGDPLPADTQLVSSADTTPESFRDAAAPLAGTAGVADALQKGLLRRATDEDTKAWNAAMAERVAHAKPLVVYDAYVVQKAFRFPAALHGGHSAKFFVPADVPVPRGDFGHSTVFDFATVRCAGSYCPDGPAKAR